MTQSEIDAAARDLMDELLDDAAWALAPFLAEDDK